MRFIQFEEGGTRHVGMIAEDGEGQSHGRRLREVCSVYELAQRAAESDAGLAELAAHLAADVIDDEQLYAKRKILPPVTHPDPAHLLITGTGLTHIDSAQARDQMHNTHAGAASKPDAADDDAAPLTDSIRMFRLGVEGGKPPSGVFFGAQPEWFYKGDGDYVVPPGGEIACPAFAEDGGEEAEIAGVYLIDRKRVPRRIGFVLGNEFSDHVMEKHNYLWLAHSKLRQCAIGPELLCGELPRDVRGYTSVRRGKETLWQKPFASGEDNMCHSIANLERHHFKYAGFCRPGDIHVHFFGAATLSFADGVKTEDGDEFVIECPVFGRPLVNRLRMEREARQTDVKRL